MDDPRYQDLDEETRIQLFEDYHEELVEKEREAQEKIRKAKAEEEKRTRRAFQSLLRDLAAKGKV